MRGGWLVVENDGKRVRDNRILEIVKGILGSLFSDSVRFYVFLEKYAV